MITHYVVAYTNHQQGNAETKSRNLERKSRRFARVGLAIKKLADTNYLLIFQLTFFVTL